MLLNQTIYESRNDSLIYDASHDFDGRNVSVSLSDGKAGTLERGQVLDIAEDGESFTVHAEGGKVGAIVYETTSYAAADADITVPVYITGSFRQSALETEVKLTAADVETFREKGIFLN